MRLPVLLVLLLTALFFGCPSHAVLIAKRTGREGWLQLDAKGPPTPEDGYRDRFEKMELTRVAPACTELAQRLKRPSGPLLVMVPGIQGDGVEWEHSLDALYEAQPVAILMYRWTPFDTRDALADGLGAGLSRLLECLPEASGRTLVLAHSAGGVVSSFAASRVQAPPSKNGQPPITLVTVASPLAGTVPRESNPDGSEQARFMLDLGTAIGGYPSAPNVRAIHLRTQYPADEVMKPSRDQHLPNDPKVGLPGSRQLTLSEGFGHVGALVWAAHRIGDGTWTRWLTADPEKPLGP